MTASFGLIKKDSFAYLLYHNNLSAFKLLYVFMVNGPQMLF